MPKARIEVACIEQMINDGRKRFVRYAEGVALYSLGLHTFQKLGIAQKSESQTSITSPEAGKLFDMEGCHGK